MNAPLNTVFIDALISLLGRDHVLTDETDKAAYLTDWRRRFSGQAQAVVRPASTQQSLILFGFAPSIKFPLYRKAAIPAYAVALRPMAAEMRLCWCCRA